VCEFDPEKTLAAGEDKIEWPPERINISLSWGEAIVLYELLIRYHESRKPELRTDRAEWGALVQLAGHLERGGVDEIPDYQGVLTQARTELNGYDAAPF
jgi:hypothetical protein